VRHGDRSLGAFPITHLVLGVGGGVQGVAHAISVSGVSARMVHIGGLNHFPHLISATVYDECSVCPFIQPMVTRCCFTMNDMFQVSPSVSHTGPGEISHLRVLKGALLWDEPASGSQRDSAVEQTRHT